MLLYNLLSSSNICDDKLISDIFIRLPRPGCFDKGPTYFGDYNILCLNNL